MKNKQPIVPRSPLYFSDEKKKKTFFVLIDKGCCLDRKARNIERRI
jgi:hypothetical protein